MAAPVEMVECQNPVGKSWFLLGRLFQLEILEE
jgi:hypothetical protein